MLDTSGGFSCQLVLVILGLFYIQFDITYNIQQCDTHTRAQILKMLQFSWFQLSFAGRPGPQKHQSEGLFQEKTLEF